MSLRDAARATAGALARISGAARQVEAGARATTAFLSREAVDPRWTSFTRLVALGPGTLAPFDPRFEVDTRIAELQAQLFTISPQDPRFQLDTRVAEIQADIFTAEPGDPRWLLFTRPTWGVLAGAGAFQVTRRPFGG